MKKNILYLEDDANMRAHTTNYLRAEGYHVEEFQRIDQVKEYFSENMDKVDCIITDLNMSDEWLGEYRFESDGCMLSGWVWLQRFVYTTKPNIPTIIYSGYISLLQDNLRKEDKLYLINKSNIICIGKGSEDNEGVEALLKTLSEKIFN